MNLTDIALKNLLRRKGKAAFILAGLVIGIATVVAVITYVETTTADINHKLEKYGANILVTPKTDQLSLSYGGLSLGTVAFEMAEIRQADLAALQTIKNARNIAAVGPVALGAVTVDSHTLLLAGVDFNAMPILKPWWQVVGRPPGPGEVLLGAKAADVLGVAVGQTVPIKGTSFTVAGSLRPTGSQDDHLMFTLLETAQAVLDKQGRVSLVEVAALCEACPIDEMVDQIGTALPAARVMASHQVVMGRMATLAQIKRFAYGISVVIVLIGGLVVLVTMMGSVRERTDEIGIFRAVGFRRRQVMRIIFVESGVVSALAGLIGYGVGFGAVMGVFVLTGGATAAVVFNPQLAVGALLLALLMGLFASVYPAWIAARLDPSQALKHI